MPGESAAGWLDRRAPNDPIGRLTIIKLGNGGKGVVLSQIRALAQENPATLAQALTEIAGRWPSEAALAWRAAFDDRPRPW